jgi:hypothetical protein
MIFKTECLLIVRALLTKGRNKAFALIEAEPALNFAGCSANLLQSRRSV